MKYIPTLLKKVSLQIWTIVQIKSKIYEATPNYSLRFNYILLPAISTVTCLLHNMNAPYKNPASLETVQLFHILVKMAFFLFSRSSFDVPFPVDDQCLRKMNYSFKERIN